MGKKLAKPMPAAPQRLKKSTQPVAAKVTKPEPEEQPAVAKPETAMDKKRAKAEAMYPTPEEKGSFNDRGPTQLTISRTIRNRFRKACFVSEETMSMVIERLMEEYATEAGF